MDDSPTAGSYQGLAVAGSVYRRFFVAVSGSKCRCSGLVRGSTPQCDLQHREYIEMAAIESVFSDLALGLDSSLAS